MTEKVPKYTERKYETIESIYQFLSGNGTPRHPADIILETSNVCDLKCAMCGPFSALNEHRLGAIVADNRGFMGPIVENLHDALTHTLRVQCFGYGEPTINPGFLDSIEFLGNYDVLTNFFSNGMHLTDALVERVVAARVFDISISFSGASKDHYENVYIGAEWETVLAGIKRLSGEKLRQCSEFPIISINSLAWQHHIDSLDTFVTLMADHGVNGIFVKPVIAVPSLSPLAAHANIYRRWVEGERLALAKQKAEDRGIYLNTALYEAAGATDESDYQRKRETLSLGFGAFPKTAPDIDIVDLRKYAATVPLHRPPTGSVERPHSAFGKPADQIEAELDFRPAADIAAEEVCCFEPFKTLYVTRNFDVKPCCNSVADQFLGNARSHYAGEIWNGRPYSTLRSGILAGSYPKMCHSCLRGGNAYVHHQFDELIATYGIWYTKVFRRDFECRPYKDIVAMGTNPAVAERHRSAGR